MSAWSETLREETISKLRSEFQDWQNTSVANEPETHNKEISTPRFMRRMFSNQNVNNRTEVDNYLNENVSPTIDVYDWWNKNKHSYPILSRIARKYLSIPATSVPSERLFSDAGNQITSKRNRLSSKVVSQLLFVKRNSLYCKIWA